MQKIIINKNAIKIQNTIFVLIEFIFFRVKESNVKQEIFIFKLSYADIAESVIYF
jgi:hypothetical protein